MDRTIPGIERALRLDDGFFDYQLETFAKCQAQQGPQRPLRHCLYYRTGAGKTITALVTLALGGATEALVITPPITQEAWVGVGQLLGIEVTAVSHAKFRQRGFLVRKHVPLVVDEFHLLGGHNGKGWKKMDRLAKGLQAALLILSATPNYNDAERVYCIKHVLDPHSTKGGFLEFLYQNCITEADPFSMTPKVLGFRHYENAEEFLKDLPYVSHVPDLHSVEVSDIEVFVPMPKEFWLFGVHRRRKRMVASQMEERHSVAHDQRVDEDGLIRPEIMAEIEPLVGNVTTPTLMFCNSSKIAEALYRTCKKQDANVGLVTGKDTQKQKEYMVEQFRRGHLDALIGTATLATGTDGMDKMCDQLIIVHDTDDNSLRKQLIGRILPRGADSDASRKQVNRIVVNS